MGTQTQIPASRIPFIDPRTGEITREWYRYLLAVDSTTSVSAGLHVGESTSNFFMDNNTWHLVCVGNVSVVLQASGDRSDVLSITNAGTGTITIVAKAGDRISGESSVELTAQWSTIQLCPYSGGYVII